MAINQKDLLLDSILAINIASSIYKEEKGYVPNTSEIEVLKNFKGFGGLKSVLYPLNIEWNTITGISRADLKMEEDIKNFNLFLQENFENHELIWASIKESVLTSFYTPYDFVDAQIKNIYLNNTNNITSFLDPCAGNGVYIDAVKNYYPDAKITAVEKDFLSAYVLTARFNSDQNVTVINQGFEDVKFQEKFDLISSNIPFGNFRVSYPEYPLEVTSKIHNFFFYHSSELLHEGGALSFLTSTGVFNSDSNKKARIKTGTNLQFIDITSLPNNLFEDAGTEVSSHLVQAIKKTNKTQSEILLNEDFMNTIEIEEVNINQHIANNFEKSFLKTPKIDTNPYGNKEFNFKMPTESIVEALFTKSYTIPQLEINRPLQNGYQSGLKTTDLFPETIYFNNLTKKQELDLLGDPSLQKQAENNDLYVLGVITAENKGKIKPISIISKIRVFDEAKQIYIKKYIIKNYVKPLNKHLLNTFLSAQDFQIAFKDHCSNIEKLSAEFSLKIDVQTKEEKDSQEFKKYFTTLFNQPTISFSYQTDFENFSFHKEIIPQMLVLNRTGEPARITNITNDTENGLPLYELEELKITTTTKNLLRDYLYLYDTYNLFLTAEREGNQIELFRERLNKYYDTFVNNHGYINDNKSINNYDTNYYPLLKSLENKKKGQTLQIDLFSTIEQSSTWEKADIFTEQIEKLSESIDPNLALAKSFNVKGKIDLEYISELSGVPEEELTDILNDKVVKNPLTNEYELKNLFYSGEIKRKIEQIENLNNESNAEIIQELKNILPTKVPFEAINMQMGVRWYPQDLLRDFLKEYFEQDFSTMYNQNLDSFFAEPKEGFGYSAKYRSYNYQCINNRYIKPEDLIYNAFYDIYPLVTFKDADDVTHTDQESTKYYKREITNLRKEFQLFTLKLPQESKERLGNIYNDKFNSLVVPTFDTDILDFTEFDLKGLGIKEIYEHQKRAVWKAINNEGGIVDHEVGLGKTFEIIATTHFGKKLGIFNKPVILGLKANIPEIAHSYRQLLPNANILFASAKDYSVKERETFLNKIKNNNYDAVIMSHEQFASIPQDPAIEQDIISQELEDIEDNLFNAKTLDISKKQLRGLEIKKKNLSVKLDALMEKMRTNKDKNVLSLSDIGIDHIVIDEAHKFKNLMFQTKHNRVAGLGSPDGSNRANNLLTAIRSIQQNTKTKEYGATFFSGTPISNSITELYLLQKYLTPVTLRERGIYNFDAWCSNFTEKSIEFETNMVNKIIAKERFRYFVNLPELSLMYNNMSDIMTGDLAKIDRPQKNEQLLLNEQTPLQKRFYIKLAKFLDSKDQSILKLDTPLNLDEKGTAISLVAMNLAFKASLDMRMISSRYVDEKDSKINKLVSAVLSGYRKYDEQKGTQIIFTDISTSKQKLSFEQLEDNYAANIFTSLYDDIKYKLMKSGVKENEIAFIQDFGTENKKKALTEKMNSGEIRILIGGTENAGTGLNVQSKLSNIYHLSIPWKPSEIEQRNGRGFRKGNILAKQFNDNKIDISICATKNTLDNYKVDLNKNKQNFITQLKGASIGMFLSRTIDEGAMDESTGMSLAELQAQLTGDTTMLDKLKIDNKIKELEQEKIFVLTKNSENKQKLNTSIAKIENLKEAKQIFQTDLDTYNKNLVVDEKGQRINEPKYSGLVEDPSSEQIHNFLKKINENAKDYHQDTEKEVAQMFGFKLFVTNHIWDGVQFKIKNLEDPKVSYTINEGKLNTESQSACLSFFVRCFDSIQRKVDNANDNIAKEEKKCEAFDLNTNNEFKNQSVLDDYIQQSEFLEEQIKNSSNDTSSTYEVKQVLVGEEPKEFKILNDFQQLDRAILHEHLGKENEEIGFFCSSKVREEMYNLSELDNSGLNFISQNLDLKTHQHFMKVVVRDYDKLYVALDESQSQTFHSVKNAHDEIANRHENKTVLITEDSNTYFCYEEKAQKVAELNNLSLDVYKGIPYLQISSKEIDRVVQNCVAGGLSVAKSEMLGGNDYARSVGMSR